MKKGFESTPERKNAAPVRQASVAPASVDSRTKVPASKKASDAGQLPTLVEFTYTASAIIVILASLIVAIVSFVKGSSLVDLVIRTGVTILVTGTLVMLISWQISSDALKVSLAELEKEKEKAEQEAKEKEEQEAKEREAREFAEEMQDDMSDDLFEEQQ